MHENGLEVKIYKYTFLVLIYQDDYKIYQFYWVQGRVYQYSSETITKSNNNSNMHIFNKRYNKVAYNPNFG